MKEPKVSFGRFAPIEIVELKRTSPKSKNTFSKISNKIFNYGLNSKKLKKINDYLKKISLFL